eukprot:13242557-Alexandrium_andersonii.AAC.1
MSLRPALILHPKASRDIKKASKAHRAAAGWHPSSASRAGWHAWTASPAAAARLPPPRARGHAWAVSLP